MTDPEIIDRIESLPVEEQDDLFELIRKRRIEQRRTEIAEVGERLRQEVRMGVRIQVLEAIFRGTFISPNS